MIYKRSKQYGNITVALNEDERQSDDCCGVVLRILCDSYGCILTGVPYALFGTIAQDFIETKRWLRYTLRYSEEKKLHRGFYIYLKARVVSLAYMDYVGLPTSTLALADRGLRTWGWNVFPQELWEQRIQGD